MFEIESAEEELLYSTDKFLKKSYSQENYQTELLLKAAENISDAAELLDSVGLNSVSDKILDLLANIK